ncbi:MAG: DUF4974 domain-containing protein [Paludibacteraceae bacterium]|nr:DUF4974 domain-containing protein [Paludibacteraceae bacterium]
MTDEQLEELLADDEVRNAYNLMADCKKAYKSEKLREKSEKFPTVVPKGSSEGMAAANSIPELHSPIRSLSLFTSSLLKIAAVFLGAVLLCGLAWAAWHTFSPVKEQQSTAAANFSLFTHHSSLPSSVRFDDVHLDSILTVVSAHYSKAVSYRNEEPRAMKLITTWNPDESLEAFIDHLNMFDYIHLTLQNDTIFVEQTNGEDCK